MSNICDVSIEITPRINKAYFFNFGNEIVKKYHKKENSISSIKTEASTHQKHVTFSKIEIIRIENFKKYNKSNKYDTNLFNEDNKCLIY
jgi:hypothetical protein